MKRIVVICLLVLPWLAMGCAGVWLLERLSVEEVFELLNRQSVSMAYVLSQWKSVGLGSLGLRYTFSAVWGPVLFWILLVQVLGIVCVWGMDRFYRKKEERLLQETACESFSDDSPLSRQIQKRLVQKERRIAYVEGQRLSDRRDFENTLHEIRSKLMTLYFMETEAEREEVIEGADALIRQFLGSAVYEACSLKALVSRALSGRGPLFKEKGVRVVCRLEDVRLVCDGLWLGQVVEMVLANAYEGVPAGGQVQVRTYMEGGYGVIHISNSIGAETVSSLTGRFHSNKEGHVGIGLSMAQEVMHRHHGFMEGHGDGGFYVVVLRIPISVLEKGGNDDSVD